MQFGEQRSSSSRVCVRGQEVDFIAKINLGVQIHVRLLDPVASDVPLHAWSVWAVSQSEWEAIEKSFRTRNQEEYPNAEQQVAQNSPVLGQSEEFSKQNHWNTINTKSVPKLNETTF